MIRQDCATTTIIRCIGLDVQLPTSIQAPAERVWQAMIDKVYNTGEYLSVMDVKTNRESSWKTCLSRNAFRWTKNIYLDDSHYEIRAYIIGEDKIRINLYHPDTDVLEY